MRVIRALPFLILGLQGPLAPAPASAQDGTLAGDYELDGRASDDVGDAIGEATEGGGFFVRNVGRRKLADKLRLLPVLRIALTDSTATITTDDGSALETPVSAGTGRGGRESVVGVTTRWDGRALVRTFREDEGLRRYRYSLEPDGATLCVEVHVEGSRLPRPVEYVLTYRRPSSTSPPAPPLAWSCDGDEGRALR